MPPRVFAPPVASQSHFHDEATLQHANHCDLVTRHPSSGRSGLNCTCRAGPEAGTAPGLLMEGPELQFRRFDADANGTEALEREVAALREEVARLRGDDRNLGVVDVVPALNNRFGKIRRGRG